MSVCSAVLDPLFELFCITFTHTVFPFIKTQLERDCFASELGSGLTLSLLPGYPAQLNDGDIVIPSIGCGFDADQWPVALELRSFEKLDACEFGGQDG